MLGSMARVNVYLPDDVALAAREANLNISRLCRDAVEQALHAARQKAWFVALADREPIDVSPDEVLAAVRAAKDEIEGAAIGDEL
jgi:post-segregation antitoxin (ccd killing protein)